MPETKKTIKIGGILSDIEGLKFKSYRKKPAIIKATQINRPFEVETLEGTMRGKGGDFLILGTKGERYPCDKDIFSATYEEVR